MQGLEAELDVVRVELHKVDRENARLARHVRQAASLLALAAIVLVIYALALATRAGVS